MNWMLRAATPSDFETVLPLVRAYHEFEGVELDEADRQVGVSRLLNEPALGGIWFVTRDEVIAGYIALCIGFSLEFGGHDAFVDEFYLASEFRGQGGGKAALLALKAEARRRDIKMLHLEVARDNARARKLYNDSGLVAREKYVLMSGSL